MKLSRASLVLAFFGLVACGGAAQSGGLGQPSAPASASSQASGAGSLDGRSFEVVLEMPDAPATPDTLHFVNGKFESTVCTTHGFPQWAEYDARTSGEGIAFHALTKHPSGTTMDWNGTVKGERVDGTANRTMNGKTDALPFKGSLRQ
jgi:hypothetical protein